MKKSMTKAVKENSNRKCSICKIRRNNFGDAIYVPVGCRACGNPAYPNCKSSCPMFDD